MEIKMVSRETNFGDVKRIEIVGVWHNLLPLSGDGEFPDSIKV
jgi:hypothetical protein